jgi:hypothetical protein
MFRVDFGAMKNLIRCRNCPNCGSKGYRRVAQSFRWGTFRECRRCGTAYPGPVRMTMGIALVLIGSLPAWLGLEFLRASRAGDISVSLGLMTVGALMILGGVAVILHNVRTPSKSTGGFSVVPAPPTPGTKE